MERYRSRLSGPLLDRIDLHVEVPPVDYRALLATPGGEASARVRRRVEAARRLQRRRFAPDGRTGGADCNAGMDRTALDRWAALDREGRRLLERAVASLGLSARAHLRILRVARTVADLEGAERISGRHLAEAIHYRTLDRPVD